MSDRIPCCVPFCRRTAREPDAPFHDWLCPAHLQLADRNLRRVLRRARRRARNVCETYPSSLGKGLRLAWYRERMFLFWERIKKQAIERSVGI